jgi:hypothetical protein
MTYLSTDNLAKSYGLKPLFKGLTFGIAKGDKTALTALIRDFPACKYFHIILVSYQGYGITDLFSIIISSSISVIHPTNKKGKLWENLLQVQLHF